MPEFFSVVYQANHYHASAGTCFVLRTINRKIMVSLKNFAKNNQGFGLVSLQICPQFICNDLIVAIKLKISLQTEEKIQNLPQINIASCNIVEYLYMYVYFK